MTSTYSKRTANPATTAATTIAGPDVTNEPALPGEVGAGPPAGGEVGEVGEPLGAALGEGFGDGAGLFGEGAGAVLAGAGAGDLATGAGVGAVTGALVGVVTGAGEAGARAGAAAAFTVTFNCIPDNEQCVGISQAYEWTPAVFRVITALLVLYSAIGLEKSQAARSAGGISNTLWTGAVNLNVS